MRSLYHPALAGYHPALAGTPPEEGNWNHLGGSFQTPMTPPATPHLSCQERQSSMTPTKPSSQETIGTEAKAPWVTLPRA